MKKMLMFVTIGIAVGYFIGFSDAHAHQDTVVQRLVDRVGGLGGGRSANDIDAQMDRLEKK